MELKKNIIEKKEECIRVKEERERLKISIKTLKKKQFEISEIQSKQERENGDVKEDIEKIN